MNKCSSEGKIHWVYIYTKHLSHTIRGLSLKYVVLCNDNERYRYKIYRIWWFSHMITESRNIGYSLRSSNACTLNVPKFNHNSLGKRTFAVWMICQQEYDLVMNLRHSNGTWKLTSSRNLWASQCSLILSIVECQSTLCGAI